MCRPKAPKVPKPIVVQTPAPKYIPPPPPAAPVYQPTPAFVSTQITPRSQTENTGVRKASGEKREDEFARKGTANFNNGQLSIGQYAPNTQV